MQKICGADAKVATMDLEKKIEEVLDRNDIHIKLRRLNKSKIPSVDVARTYIALKDFLIRYAPIESEEEFERAIELKESAELSINELKTSMTDCVVVLDYWDVNTIAQKYNAYLEQCFQKRQINKEEDYVILTAKFLSGVSQFCDRVLDKYPKRKRKKPKATNEKKWSDIIGAEEASQILAKASSQVFLYDSSTGENFEKDKINHTVLLYGRPGTGKSSLINAMISQMQQYSRALGVELNYEVLDNSVKDKYFGESVKELKRRLDAVINPSGIGLLVIDDADMILQSRDSHDASHSELQLVRELMNLISGVGSNYLGNYMIVATTNKIDRIEEALFNRFPVKVEVVGPQSSDEYIRLLQNELISGVIEIDKKEWTQIGNYCSERNLSGRSISNVANNCLQRMTNGIVSVELCKLPYDERKARREKQYKVIQSDDVIEMVMSA
jgi:AAA+ superfamily predicted ATPase